MHDDFNKRQVSVVLLLPEGLPYDLDSFKRCVAAVHEQDHPNVQAVIVDGQSKSSAADYGSEGMTHVPGEYANRAAMCNAGIQAATGEYVLLVFSEAAPVVLRRSAVRTMLMVASRATPPAFVYADYERVDAQGARSDVHLLDWHAGRLRDTVDFGRVLLFRTAELREVGGFDERYGAADWYDLRLRLTERAAPAHIANRYAGALYAVESAGTAHNVFDYLMMGKDAQIEMERVLGEHLRRTGAYLEPGAHVTPRQDAAMRTGCIASIVIPVNNRPEFIGRAIESVQAQTVKQVEVVVVVNGGANDPTAAAVQEYMPGGAKHVADAPDVRLIVVDVNNLGLCLNTGIAAARGQYYVQLDSDDRLKPDAVEKLLAVFESDPTIGMVIGSYEVWTLDEETGKLARNEEIPVVTHDEWTAENGRNNLLRINGAGAPRSASIDVIRAAGWFGVNDSPHSRNYGEDYDLVLRISERYTIGRVWDPIYEVIRHAGGTDHAIDQATVDRNDNAKDHMRLEALERRRALNAKV